MTVYIQTLPGSRFSDAMEPVPNNNVDTLYRACRDVLGEKAWARFSTQWAGAIASYSLSKMLSHQHDRSIPKFLSDLARLEETILSVNNNAGSIPAEVDRPGINPTLQIIEASWKNLTVFLGPDQRGSSPPVQTSERILVYYNHLAGCVITRPATDEDPN